MHLLLPPLIASMVVAIVSVSMLVLLMLPPMLPRSLTTILPVTFASLVLLLLIAPSLLPLAAAGSVFAAGAHAAGASTVGIDVIVVSLHVHYLNRFNREAGRRARC